MNANQFELIDLAHRLLAWYDRQKRDLPWRRSKDPYRIWLAEIMLQQTQVSAVIPYFDRFLQTWPQLSDLARARDDQVMKAWEGLGYYSRARNLLAAARLIETHFSGVVPKEEKELLSLPGIGEYTAAAIAAIAFGRPVVAVDGNLVRVFARLTAKDWDPSNLSQRRQVRRLAESLLPADRPGDYNEALMDLGATICLPRRPNCSACPLAELCLAFHQGQVERYPAKPRRRPRPVENKIVLVLIWQKKVHVSRRPARGLLAGLYQFDWLSSSALHEGQTTELMLAQMYPGAKISFLGEKTHHFTHKQWQLDGYAVQVEAKPELKTGLWVDRQTLATLPFPTALAGYREQVLLL